MWYSISYDLNQFTKEFSWKIIVDHNCIFPTKNWQINYFLCSIKSKVTKWILIHDIETMRGRFFLLNNKLRQHYIIDGLLIIFSKGRKKRHLSCYLSCFIIEGRFIGWNWQTPSFFVLFTQQILTKWMN